jgi:hypothetical protein
VIAVREYHYAGAPPLDAAPLRAELERRGISDLVELARALGCRAAEQALTLWGARFPQSVLCVFCGDDLPTDAVERRLRFAPYLRVDWGPRWVRGAGGHEVVHRSCATEMAKRRERERPMDPTLIPAYQLGRYRSGWEPATICDPRTAAWLYRRLIRTAHAEQTAQGERDAAEIAAILRLLEEMRPGWWWEWDRQTSVERAAS